MLACHYIKIFGVALSAKVLWSADENCSRGELEDMILAGAWYANAYVVCRKKILLLKLRAGASGLVSVGKQRTGSSGRFAGKSSAIWMLPALKGVSQLIAAQLAICFRGAEAVIQITQKYKQSAALFVCNMSRACKVAWKKGAKVENIYTAAASL